MQACLKAKLQAFGVGSLFLNFFSSYLQPRRAQVVVEGVCSDNFNILDTVFQGTVLGPPLWNIFFNDVVIPAGSTGGDPNLFADDLSVFQKFDRLDDNDAIKLEMDRCRSEVHSWGKRNRVSFDASKEHVVILHPIHGQGDPVILLGCLLDCKLLMNHGIENILARMRPKVVAILRLRGHYHLKELLNQFQTHVWGLVEYQNGAIFHAAAHLLNKINRIQNKFLEELGLDVKTAFIEYNFVPLDVRRDIGIL